MGPNTNTPNYNQTPVPQGGNFASSEQSLPQYNVDPNTTSNTSPEHFNQAPLQTGEQLARAEQLAQPTQAMPAGQPVYQPQPVVAQQVPTNAVPTTKQPTAQQLAKEWVGRAQQTVAATRNDPHEQAHQVALLMQGYLRERYGKIVGDNDK